MSVRRFDTIIYGYRLHKYLIKIYCNMYFWSTPSPNSILNPNFVLGHYSVCSCSFLFLPVYSFEDKDANSNNLKKRFQLDLSIFNIQVPEVDLIKWPNQGSKINIYLLKIFICLIVDVEKKIFKYLFVDLLKSKSTKKYWFRKRSTNSTNKHLLKIWKFCKNS